MPVVHDGSASGVIIAGRGDTHDIFVDGVELAWRGFVHEMVRCAVDAEH